VHTFGFRIEIKPVRLHSPSVMTDRQGVTRTAKEAMICKMSSSTLICEAPDSHRTLNEERRAMKKIVQNPLLNRMYHARHLIVHKMVSSCLNSFKIITTLHQNQRCQLLLLGAGIDVSFEKLYCDSAVVFSLDLPEIVKERKAVLSGVQTEETLINNSVSDSFAAKMVAVPGDLRSFSTAWSSLLVNGFNAECPTIVVVECVLCYIDTPSVEKLLQHLSGHLCKQSVLITYDPLAPRSSYSQSSSSVPMSNGFAQMMADKFEDRKVPILHSIETKEILRNFILSCKWKYVLTLNMYQALHCFLTAEERRIKIALEPFDEFTSLALLHRLYGVTFASLDGVLYAHCLSHLVSSQISAENYQKYIADSFDKKVYCCSDPPTESETPYAGSTVENNLRSSARTRTGNDNKSSNVIKDNDDVSVNLLLSRISSLEIRVDSLLKR
jgi:O-methyltransferase involved in polyketide biosynthesis